MELVVLSREGAEPWGFRLIGGTDFKMPLTVVKVLPDSPAEKAGLQNGDTVSRIGDKVADDLSHEDARLIVDGAKTTLQLGVKRGLYDPVLDNYEPIYEDIDQIERADIDQPSQPTEVQDPFQIQQFLDPTQDIFPPKELTNATQLSEPRSLTASPFVLPTKPYRPFSTEPLPQIPPLEDPIILNPNYRDEFGKILDNLDDFGELNGKYESKFKLPISEQYDPNWENKEKNVLDKNKKGVEVKFTEVVTNNVTENVLKMEKHEVASEKKEQLIKEDIAFMKKMKQEIDLDKIEMTATSIVDESIEKAKTVAEEIKKEIDVELTDISSLGVSETKTVKGSQISIETKAESFKTSKQETVEKQFEHEDLGIVKREIHVSKESKENNEDFEDVTDKSEMRVSKKVEKFETVDFEDHISDERKKYIQKEVEEVIESGTVSRKSKMFDKEELNLGTKVKADVGTEEVIESGSVKRKSTMFENEEVIVDSKVKSDVDIQRRAKYDIKRDNIETTNVDQKTSETKISGSKSTSSQAENRAYTIGLKTIPNIRGTVHSSYHYNLLLHTFFLHLTDVMVALSRFILSEPVFNKVEEKQDSLATQQTNTTTFESKKATKRSEDTNTSENRVISKTSENAVQEKEQSKTVEDIKKINKVEQTKICSSEVNDKNIEIKTHKKAVSGSEMAQLSEKKSGELTVKMDAVISEFENKTGIEETAEHHRRSRSRSQVVEEVRKESDPLEWLSKVDGHKTQEIDLRTETKTISSEFSSTVESTATKTEISNAVINAAEKKNESRQGSRARSCTPNKQMYVAIVESHVYTNKDTVLLDQTDISETSSVAEESNIVSESLQTVATETTSSINENKRRDDVSVVTAKQQEMSEAKSAVAAEKTNATSVKSDMQTMVVAQKVNEPVIEVRENKLFKTKVKEIMKESKESVSEQVKSKTIQNDIKVQESSVQQIKEQRIEMSESKQSQDKIEEIHKKVETMQTEVKTQDILQEQVSEPIVELYESKEIDIKQTKESTVTSQNSDIGKHETIEIQEIVSESIEEEHETHGYVELAKEEAVEVKKEQTLELDVSANIKVDKVEITEIKPKLESAALKIVKEQVIEVQPSPEILEKEETKVLKIEKVLDMSKGTVVESESQFVDISSSSSFDSIDIKSKTEESSFTAKSVAKSESSFTASSISESIQESSFTARSTETSAQKLTLRTDLAQKSVLDSQTPVSGDDNNNIDTPTPSTVPPTPVTDEYVFKLKIPLPKTSGKVIPLDLTPEEEDLHVAKKHLVAHIDTTLESPIIYDPPLPSPPGTKVTSPVYTKPGLRGGNMCYPKKEEILEIERKSTLLASAIDETIKSIEEYKEQVGMETKKEEESTTTFSSHTENYSKEEKTVSVSKTEVKRKMGDEWSEVQKQVESNNKSLTEISKVSNGVETTEPVVLMNGYSNANKIDQIEDKISNGINGAVKENIETKLSTKSSESNSAVDQCLTNGVNGIHNVITDVGSVAVNEEKVDLVEEKEDPMKGFRPVVFNPEPRNPRATGVYIDLPPQPAGRPYTTPTGELLGTHQGIVDGLEEATVDEQVAKELGKPGMTEEKIAELISGESEMLREAHVMGLTRVITSHMSRADDSSVDFQKIKPIVDSLRDSEVLKALNEELLKKSKEEKKKDQKKWTTFLQKPKRAVPRAKFGYRGYVEDEQVIEAPYKVKIVKQPKPKVAPDYKPENFETGPLPWEERALNEPPPPPVEAEDPILVPEEEPEFLEAVDPLPESEVPDLEDTGIPLPPPKSEEPPPPPEPVEEAPEDLPPEEPDPQPERVEEKEEMENRIAEQLVSSVQSMVDPNASLEQQLSQMRAQLAALAQLPGVIQHTLEMVSRQLSQICQQESVSLQSTQQSEVTVEEIQQSPDENEAVENNQLTITEETNEDIQKEAENSEEPITNGVVQTCLTREEMEKLKKEEEEMLEEQRRIEKQKKEMMERMQDQQSRQVKSHPTPRVGKPKPVFGNGDEPRPLVLPGGRRWRGPKDAYNEQLFAETMCAQAELIQGKAMGMSFESDLLPYDTSDVYMAPEITKSIENWNVIWPWGDTKYLIRQNRVNFLKYEKPPVSLDHLQNSDVYKLVHGMEAPVRRVDMLTPVIAEADYREKCRSISPCVGRMGHEQHQEYPQQVQP